MSFGSYMFGVVAGGVGAIVGITLSELGDIEVTVDENLSVCEKYNLVAENLNDSIIANGDEATITVETKDGETCTFQHVTPAPVRIPSQP